MLSPVKSGDNGAWHIRLGEGVQPLPDPRLRLCECIEAAGISCSYLPGKLLSPAPISSPSQHLQSSIQPQDFCLLK